MRRLGLLTKIVTGLLILVSVPMASYAKSHVHHGNHGATMEVSGPPSLQTASTPSAYFQQDSRLWLAWFHKGHIYVNYSDDLAKIFSQPVIMVKLVPRSQLMVRDVSLLPIRKSYQNALPVIFVLAVHWMVVRHFQSPSPSMIIWIL